MKEKRQENDTLKLQLSTLTKDISKTKQKLQDYQRENQVYSKDIQSKQYVTVATCFLSDKNVVLFCLILVQKLFWQIKRTRKVITNIL